MQGIWEKQSSFLMVAKATMLTLDGNIFYNGPRAGINYNVGAGISVLARGCALCGG